MHQPSSSEAFDAATAALADLLPEGGTLDPKVPLGREGASVSLACIPASGGELPAAVRAWVEADPDSGGEPAVWMAFQGSHIHWSSGRAAILAPGDRLESVRAVVIEATAHERELRSIERSMASWWPDLEGDSQLAFEFEESAVGRRRQLRERLHRVLVLRARLARIAPYLLSPLRHPPTLASQVADRMRERLRMAARHEAAALQIEVFRDTYETCGARASEFMLARTGHRLEWTIIVLLAAQLLLWGFEYLSLAAE